MTEKINTNVINGFYSIKNCLDRDNQKVSTRYTIGDIGIKNGVSKDDVRYMIGDTISKERKAGIKVKDIAQEYGIAKSTIYRYLDIAKNYQVKNKEEIHNPTYVAKSKPGKEVQHVKANQEIPVVIPQETKRSQLEETVLGPIGSNGLPLGAPDNSHVGESVSLGTATYTGQIKNRLKKIGLGIAAAVILAGGIAGCSKHYQEKKLHEGFHKPGITCPVENPQTVNIYCPEEVNIYKSQKSQCHNQKAVIQKPAKVEKHQQGKKKHVNKQPSCEQKKVEAPGYVSVVERTKTNTNYVVEEVKSETNYVAATQETTVPDTRYVAPVVVEEINQDTPLVQSYSQSDLEKILSICCEPVKRVTSDKKTAGWLAGKMLFNYSSIGDANAEYLNMRFNDAKLINEGGEKIFGKDAVIDKFEVDGLKWFNYPNDLEGNNGYVGMMLIKGAKVNVDSELNDVRVFHKPTANVTDATTRWEVKKSKVTFRQAGDEIKEAQAKGYILLRQDQSGKHDVLDAYGIQTKTKVMIDTADFPYTVSYEDPNFCGAGPVNKAAAIGYLELLLAGSSINVGGHAGSGVTGGTTGGLGGTVPGVTGGTTGGGLGGGLI